MIEPAHRHATRQHQHVVCVEMPGEPVAHLRRVVRDVILCGAWEAAHGESGAHRVRIRAAYLPGLDRQTRLDELIARGDDHDARLGTDARMRETGRGEHGELGWSKAGSLAEQPDARLGIEPACMHVHTWFDCEVGGQFNLLADYRDPLDRHHAVAAAGQDGARHHLETGVATGQAERWLPGGLRSRDPESPRAPRMAAARECDAVHGHAIERRLIAFGVDVLGKDGARQRRQRPCLDGQRPQARQDPGTRFGRIRQGLT